MSVPGRIHFFRFSLTTQESSLKLEEGNTGEHGKKSRFGSSMVQPLSDAGNTDSMIQVCLGSGDYIC